MKKVKVEPGVSTLMNTTGDLHRHEFVGASTVHITVDDDFEVLDRELVDVADSVIAGKGVEVMKSAKGRKFKEVQIFDVVSAKMNHMSRGEGVERDEKGRPLQAKRKLQYKMNEKGSLIRDLDREKELGNGGGIKRPDNGNSGKELTKTDSDKQTISEAKVRIRRIG